MSIYLIPNAKPHITVEDWFRNFHQYQKNYEEILQKSFTVKQESNKLRDSSTIETEWNLTFTNDLLEDRIKEVGYWKNEVFEFIQRINNELQLLNREKDLCSKDIENLYSRFAIINECNTLRNSKKRGDLCQDDATIQLNQEYQLLENVKANLTDKCEEACQQNLRLKTLLDRLQLDLELKTEAHEIEKETLEFKNIPTSVSHKPDLNNELNYCSHNSWLENCKKLKIDMENELEASSQLRKEICIPRENSRNLLLSQHEATNYMFRKRIYETHFILDELKWEKGNLEKEKERMMMEINKLEETHHTENDALKLVESQNRNRVYRSDSELCREKCTDNLEIQVLNIKSIIQKLNQQLEISRKTHHHLEEQIDTMEKEIKKKTWALTLDKRCLEIRNEANASIMTFHN